MTPTASDHVWNLLLDIAFQSCLLCAVAGGGLLLLRRTAAASRYLVLRLLVGCLLALPLLSLVLPRWQWNWQSCLFPQQSVPQPPPPPPSTPVLPPEADFSAPKRSKVFRYAGGQ